MAQPGAPGPVTGPAPTATLVRERRAGLQRRGLTVLVGAVVVAMFGFGVAVTPLPYVVLQPGPTIDTLGEQDGEPVIEVPGAPPGESTGELRLTTVSVQPQVNLVGAVRAWFSDEEAVVPEEMVYPPGQTREEVEERNTEQFTQSQSAAESAAMRQLGDFPVRVAVAEVVAGGPSEGKLAAGDIVTAVDGVEITVPEDLSRLVGATPPGTALEVAYERDGEPGTATITTAPDQDDPEVARIGVLAATVVDHPYELDIRLEHIGGPSAGLMFALGIIDKLDPVDLTSGRVIAGTGSINPEGEVGPIGGVAQKLVAARDAGATVFLVPEQNCPEAVANAQPGLLLAEVGTLAEALDALAALRSGGQPETCG